MSISLKIMLRRPGNRSHIQIQGFVVGTWLLNNEVRVISTDSSTYTYSITGEPTVKSGK